VLGQEVKQPCRGAHRLGLGWRRKGSVCRLAKSCLPEEWNHRRDAAVLLLVS